MAFTVRTLSLILLLLLAVVFTFPTGTASISAREYQSMQGVLRSHGYNLICNAMATSDLQYLLLTLPTNASFTVFAPTDASLFALDMIQTASSYTDTLRVHIVPLRLSLSDLRSLSSGSILPTLLPFNALRLSTSPLAVSGVDVVLPGLFFSRRVAVHGLGGIVSLSSVVPYGSHPQASAPVASGGADKVVPLTAESNRTDLSPAATPPSKAVSPLTTQSNGSDLSPAATPPSKAVSPLTTQSNRTDLSPAATPPSKAESPVTNHPNRTVNKDLSPAEAELPVTTGRPSLTGGISPTSEMIPLASSPSADSVPERARALLMEITDDNSESDGDEIFKKSSLLMEAQAVAKVEKCGASDEMTIDCFVPEDGTGLEHLSIQRVVRAMA
ncbi:hypothetical protein M0R45_026539 [Rubus argutus]|uniref:FAS1 domain-containing protein n=1 Tax=Rubus argutus TaxID=59490 RepID=A0AAW1WYA3_RUBAR